MGREYTGSSVALTDTAAVRRDAAGVPTAFRVLKRGENLLTQDGTLFKLNADEAFIGDVLNYHAMKGEAIPVDAEHFLRLVADLLKVEEPEVLRVQPKLGELAVEGLVTLKEEGGDIWANVVKWSARAKQLLSAAGDKLYAYFSPVIRGLKDGKPRMTSISLTNVPALNDLDVLAARGERINPKQGTNGGPMKDLITKLATLLGLDAVALTAEGADLAPMLTKAADEIGAGRKAVDGVKSFLSGVKDALSLKDTDTLEIAAGTVMSLSAKAKADALALTDAQAKLADHVKADKQRLIDSLKAEGKLTEAMATNWAPGLDIVALTDWAKHAPVIVPGGKTVKPGDKPADDTLTLTDNDIRIARACGMDPDKVKKTKLPVHE